MKKVFLTSGPVLICRKVPFPAELAFVPAVEAKTLEIARLSGPQINVRN